MRRKQSEFDKQSHLQDVLDCFNEGLMTFQIIAKLRDKWQCSQRTVERYIHIAKDHIRAQWANKDLAEELFNSFNHLYQLSILNKNLPEARKNKEAIAHYGLGEKHNITLSDKTKWAGDGTNSNTI